MKATAKAEAPSEAPKAAELARMAINKSGNDVVQATELLESWAREDTLIWIALTEDVLRLSCYNACRSVCREQRREVWFSPGYDGGGKGDRIREHGATLLDFPLPGGKPLRDASRDDLASAAEFYRTQAMSMNVRAVWLEFIAKRVKNKTVGETLTDAQLRKLQSDAQESQGAA